MDNRKRVAGYDVARALAIIGMVVVNFKMVMNAGMDGPDWLIWLTELLEGRAAAIFVILTGVGISLLSKRAFQEGDRSELSKKRLKLLKRAAFLFICGLLFTPIWPADILRFYGAYIAICSLLLSASNRKLWTLSTIFASGFVVMMVVFDYERGWNWETLDYNGLWTPVGFTGNLFFNGFHPIFPWTAFILAGMWLGRQDVTNPKFQKRVLLFSGLIVSLTELLSKISIHFFSESVTATEQEIIKYLLGTGPMPPMPFYLLSGGGVAMIVIVLCVIIAEKHSPNKLINILSTTGQMSLTIYFAHVVIGMRILEELGLLNERTLYFAIGSALLFCFCSILFACNWRKRFERGPLEWLINKLIG